MNWNNLTTAGQLDRVDEESKNHAVLIYKHSTRCGTCTTALGRIERKFAEGDEVKLKPYYLDLLEHRDISNAIAQRYGIEHQSPQVLVIKDGKCVLSQSHMQINYADLIAAA